MPAMPHRDDRFSRHPPVPQWKGRDSLGLIHQLNVSGLKRLSDAARKNTCAWPPIAKHRDVWAALEVDAIERAGGFPFVIVEIHFTLRSGGVLCLVRTMQ